MDLTPDPILERLSTVVRTRLAELPAKRDSTGGDELSVLREMEAHAFEAPQHAGGFDLGLSCGVVICAELGRLALDDPYTGGALVIDAASAAGDHRGAATQIATGKTTAVAVGFDAPPVAVMESGLWRLSGTVAIPESGLRDAACCLPFVADGELQLALLSAETWQKQVTWSRARGAVLDLEGIDVADDEVIGGLGHGDPLSDPDRVLARARVRQAAYLQGLGQGAHSLAVRHAAVRRQFGKPIVDFQAVAFPLAQAAIALRGVHLSVVRAAWLADNDHEFSLEAAETLALAAETAAEAVRLAVQIHGARGMSLSDSPMPGFLRAMRPATTRFGSPTRLWTEAGARRLRMREAG